MRCINPAAKRRHVCPWFASRLALITVLGSSMLLPLGGCRSAAKNDRDWSPDQAVLPYADFADHEVAIHNIRNCQYITADDYEVHHYDKTYDLDAIQAVYFVMVPFSDFPGGAHTFLSFEFEGPEYVAVSVEIRREKGEGFSAFKGLTGQYEIMYVVGDERDLIRLRANYRLDDVYVYKGRATKQQARDLFVDMLKRANQLREKPELYNLLTNNCTTNIARHVNDIAPHRVPYSLGVLLPGYSDRLAYELGLLDTDKSFQRTKEEARVNKLAYMYRDSPDFSLRIRR